MPSFPIQLKRNGTAAATPSSLLHGEVALNYADGKLFWKDASNVIQSFTFQAYALSSHTHAASDITSGTLDAARIANDSITYAKLQNVSATDRLLGRSSAGAGDVEEITCTAFGRSLIDDADAAAARSTLSVQPTASPAFTGAATVTNDGNVVPLTVTNAGTANSFVVNDASGDTSPFVIDASGAVLTGGALTVRANSGSASHLFTYNENGGEIILYDEAQVSATLFDQISTDTRLLELVNGSNLKLGLGGGNTTGSIQFMRAGYVESVVINSSGQLLVTAGSGSAGSYKPGVAVSGDDDTGLQQVGGAGTISIVTQGSERVRVDASGNVGIGGAAFYALDVQRTSANAILNVQTTTSGNAQLRIECAGNASSTITQNRTSNNLEITNGSTGSIVFTNNGSERVRVDAGGNVGIGVTPAANTTSNVQASGDITLYGASRGFLGNLYFQSGWKYAGTGHGWGWIEGSGSVDFSRTSSSGTAGNTATLNTAIRINSDSEVLIGTTTDQGNFKLQVAGNTYLENLYLSTTVNYGRLAISHAGATTFAAGWNNTDTSSTGQTTLNILRNGVSVGTISTTNAATSYNTTSDYRLKANPRPITDATERISRIKPSQWDWHVGGVGEGFLAHELVDAVPLAVTGEKDAVDATGNPVWQTVDMSKVVPVLVAALQEANARIAALEERLNHA